MKNNNIIDVNEIDFESKVLDESSNRLVVVDFWAPWCGPCKQLTPVLEKIISLSPDKITLAKINIDENQQIAAQLRIQSIPAVFAFKEKQLVNAFQGVIPETEIISFLEKALGGKLNNNFDDFYLEIDTLLKNQNFDEAQKKLEDFVSENSGEIKGVCLYANCLIENNQPDKAKELIDALDDESLNNADVQKILKRIKIVDAKDTNSIESLKAKLHKSPKDTKLVLKIADTYFATNRFDDAFEILLSYYPTNEKLIKEKLLTFFDVLGFGHESVILYRKKLSSIMFS